MRLITRTIWRAFAELDGFDDEQCKRFVRAAAKGGAQRALRWCGVTVATLAGVLLLPGALAMEELADRRGWIAGRAVSALLAKPAWMGEIVYLLIMLAGVLGVAALCGLVTRDVLLRWRVREVLRSRGVCASCRYFLGGLPVGLDGRVVCAECGFVTQVDESLGELVRDGSGGARFAPSAQLLVKHRPWITTAQVVRVCKWAGVALLVLVVLLAGVLGINEWRVRGQAARARAVRPTIDSLSELLRRGTAGPPGRAESGGVSALLQEVLSRMGEIDREVFPAGLGTADGELALGGEWVSPRRSADEYEGFAKSVALNGPASERVLVEYERRGVFELVERLTRGVVSVEPPAAGSGELLVMRPWSMSLGQLRMLARWEGARMRRALEDNDPERFAQALDHLLGLSELASRQSTVIGWLVGGSMENDAIREARAALVRRPTGPWVRAIKSVHAQRLWRPDALAAFELERKSMQDTVGWIFSDADRTRFGRHSPALQRDLQKLFASSLPESDLPLGTLEENLSVVKEYFDAITVEIPKPRWLRASVKTGRSDLMLPSILTGGHTPFIRAIDHVVFEREGLGVMLAIEEHRLRTGTYPGALSDLVPAELTAVPVDSWTGKAFGYRRIEAATDAHKRGYLLYSVGQDGVDNGGVAAPFALDALFQTWGSGTDLIINDPSR